MAFTKRGSEVRKEFEGVRSSERGQLLEREIVEHLDRIVLVDPYPDREIETVLAEDTLAATERNGTLKFERGLVTFSPSSAAKCPRELFFKANRVDQDLQPFFAYQKRWTRNGSAVHSAMQRDLLYAEKYLEAPRFLVERNESGRPAWERNIAVVRQFTHRGVKFQIHGMMDGIIRYTPDGSKIGLEYKTKSTTISAIGSYKLKGPQESHRIQQVAYSLLFSLNEFLIVYESLAKDGWNQGENAKPDLRPFYVKVTEEDRELLLDRFAEVAAQVYADTLPTPDFTKCMFCPYKGTCREAA